VHEICSLLFRGPARHPLGESHKIEPPCDKSHDSSFVILAAVRDSPLSRNTTGDFNCTCGGATRTHVNGNTERIALACSCVIPPKMLRNPTSPLARKLVARSAAATTRSRQRECEASYQRIDLIGGDVAGPPGCKWELCDPPRTPATRRWRAVFPVPRQALIPLPIYRPGGFRRSAGVAARTRFQRDLAPPIVRPTADSGVQPSATTQKYRIRAMSCG
jgi:hypothetical protein